VNIKTAIALPLVTGMWLVVKGIGVLDALQMALADRWEEDRWT
jgi:hypothetical protein